jgi:hypothetical protein
MLKSSLSFLDLSVSSGANEGTTLPPTPSNPSAISSQNSHHHPMHINHNGFSRNTTRNNSTNSSLTNSPTISFANLDEALQYSPQSHPIHRSHNSSNSLNSPYVFGPHVIQSSPSRVVAICKNCHYSFRVKASRSYNNLLSDNDFCSKGKCPLSFPSEPLRC